MGNLGTQNDKEGRLAQPEAAGRMSWLGIPAMDGPNKKNRLAAVFLTAGSAGHSPAGTSTYSLSAFSLR
ncbi:hypothetical protein SAMN05216562_1133 [Microbulbifer marinus]|uniref:Uncharacterized protein n=1 Tax=Microbulbifer marinus TaxID=658218 RepID=A0A1H3WU36_9GAMM|nr:hypothetical protein SAMN05216562_1133 [Microbulbifer marinus]